MNTEATKSQLLAMWLANGELRGEKQNHVKIISTYKRQGAKIREQGNGDGSFCFQRQKKVSFKVAMAILHIFMLVKTQYAGCLKKTDVMVKTLKKF